MFAFIIKLNEPTFDPDSMVGERGTSGTSIDDTELGVVYVGTKAIIAKTYQGTIRKDWPVLVVEYSKQDKTYRVEKFA